jgi:hypothetical protein
MQHKSPRSSDTERLVNAAHRFAKIARNSPVKLFGLLYMLDIRFYRMTGRSCTGETYYAMADGPAPGRLRHLLVMRDLGLDAGIGLLTATDSSGPWPFEPRHYCQRALAIVRELEKTYADAGSRELSLGDANAWWRAYNRSRGVGAIIPFEMTLPNADANPAERKRFGRRFSVNDANLPDYHILYKSSPTAE